MTDRRLTPCNARVAHVSLRDKVKGVSFVEGTMSSVIAPVANLLREPRGGLERQLLFGDSFLVLEPDSGAGYCFGQAQDGNYVGYIQQANLGVFVEPTHIICSLGAHIYPEPQLKTIPLMGLPFAAYINIARAENGYCQLATGGFIPLQQIAPLGRNFTDFVTVAESFLRVPYLWGGDSNTGLDCSALVHIALRAQGITCPRDSDLQEKSLGTALTQDAELQRGDLVFWKGHVGIMQDGAQILHANAHFMAVTSEPLADVSARVVAAGAGQITTRRRLSD
ncbi:MAG: C40 family peptidase [Rhodobacteraceae bacterium]|nr:C40 family peptidase [Paracoccaceae bacterium]